MAEDFRSAQYSREKPEPGKVRSGAVNARWWEVEPDEISQYVLDVGERLREDSENQAQVDLRHARLYENAEITSLAGRDYNDAIARSIIATSGLMSLNVVASCIDTLASKVTKNRPRPEFLGSGASWVTQIKARALDKWCRGFFYQTKVYKKSPQVFVDGCVFGTGFMHVFPTKDKKLDCERTIGGEIFVDQLDGQYGDPRQMLRLKLVSRDVLKRKFPKFERQIMEAGKSLRIETTTATPEVAENTLEVWEAWHLPSSKGAKDGKHVICIDGCTLFEEQWKVCRFPFVEFRFKKRTTGYRGKGVAETVQGIQIELNKVVRSISQQYKRKGKGRTYIPLGSKLVPAHMTNNDGGDLIYFAGGVPPHVDNGNAIAAEEFNYLNVLYQKAFQECGISELSAAAKKPSGLDAAVALREYSDIESERFARLHQDWEQFYLDYAELAIELITEQYGWEGYKVLVPGRRDLLTVDWAEVNMDRDSYVMQIWPVSSLPQTPAARLQRVEELRSKGYITDPQAKRLLDFPDIEAEENLGNAMIDDVDATISHILDDETPKLMPLEPYQNLDLIIERANATYLYARHRNCPEERLSLLRNLIDNATKQKAALMAPAPMPGAPAGGPPMPGAPAGAPPMPGAPPVGGPQITNTLNVPPPVVPAVPPVVQ